MRESLETPGRIAVTAMVVVATILFVATVGWCLVDLGGHEHASAGMDPCATLALATAVIALTALGAIGSATAQPVWPATAVAVPTPDPPPWRAPFVPTR
jgi:hypothetical protein